MKKLLFIIIFASLMVSCKTSRVPVDESPEYFIYNPGGKGPEIEIEFTRGKKHNHPLMAIWVEEPDGQFIQTLYVAESIGKGIFRHGDTSEGFWKPGEIRRPAALPYWSHRRGIQAEDGLYIPSPRNPVPDAYTGPTPGKSFIIKTRLDEQGPDSFYVLFELNQTWDWNEYWTNNKFPDDDEYKTSCQPAIVYSALIDLSNPQKEYEMQIIGRSHESGANGELYDDLHTLTTALQIAEKITVRIPGSGAVN